MFFQPLRICGCFIHPEFKEGIYDRNDEPCVGFVEGYPENGLLLVSYVDLGEACSIGVVGDCAVEVAPVDDVGLLFVLDISNLVLGDLKAADVGGSAVCEPVDQALADFSYDDSVERGRYGLKLFLDALIDSDPVNGEAVALEPVFDAVVGREVEVICE